MMNTHTLPVLKAYGRNIQALVEYITQCKDKAQRTALTQDLVLLIQTINPKLRRKPELLPKIWQDILIMSNYKLDIDPPYPINHEPMPQEPLTRMQYNKKSIKSKYYGENIATLIQRIGEIKDPQLQKTFLIDLIKLMWIYHEKKNNIAIICNHINEIAEGKIAIDFTELMEQLQGSTNTDSKNKLDLKNNTKEHN